MASRRAGAPLRRAGDHPPRGDRRRGARRRATSTRRRRPRYLESIGFWGPRTLAAHGVWVDRRGHRDPEAARRRRVAQPRKQHEAGERHGAGRRSTSPPAWRSASAPTAPPATTTSTCSRRCGRRRSSPSTRRAIRPPCRRRRRWTWRRSAARGRSGMERLIGSLEAGQARRPDHRVDARRPPDAAVRSGVAPRLRHPRRRRAERRS